MHARAGGWVATLRCEAAADAARSFVRSPQRRFPRTVQWPSFQRISGGNGQAISLVSLIADENKNMTIQHNTHHSSDACVVVTAAPQSRVRPSNQSLTAAACSAEAATAAYHYPVVSVMKL